MLTTGSRVRLAATQVECDVLGLLGEGSQGAVYLATVRGGQGAGGRDLALKWYFPQAATDEQWRALTMLVGRGSPGERFLWPLDLARSHDVPGFGYVMALRPAGYVGLADLMGGRVDVAFRVVTTLGLEFADSFLALHNHGLCYRDISFGNVFFDPVTGAALLLRQRQRRHRRRELERRTRHAVLHGARDRARTRRPSATTDLCSLAVLLFYMFIGASPARRARAVEYDCWDPEALLDLFGAGRCSSSIRTTTRTARCPGSTTTWWPPGR